MALIRWHKPSARADSFVPSRPSEFFSEVPVTDAEMIGLWQRLLVALPQRSRITLGVISSSSGEGVSTVVRGLARVVAKNPTTKVLICEVFGAGDDCVRGSSVSRPSVVDLVFSSGRLERSNTVQWLAGNRVALGSLGDARWLNAVATDPDSVSSIITALSERFELVLLDLPPIDKSIASPAFARAVDGIVIVVEAERTPAHAVRALHDTVSLHGGNVLGVVLNKRRLHGRGFMGRRYELAKWTR